MKLLPKEISQKKIIILNRTNLIKIKKQNFFLCIFPIPSSKFYYFYCVIVALKFKISRKRSRIINSSCLEKIRGIVSKNFAT